MYNEFVTTEADQSAAEPVFTNCVRCGYALRGLPVDHFFPECGLRFDERCALFRATDAKGILIFWFMILGTGWTSLEHLPGITNLANLPVHERFMAITAVAWIVCAVAAVWFLVKRYRKGFEVAITTDGLILNLPGFKSDLIPWSGVSKPSVKHRAEGKPQIASLYLKSKKTDVDIGGMANVFPRRSDVERFVSLVQERIESQGDVSESADEVK